MGRDKFGHSFGVNVCRELSDGTFEWIDLAPFGITRDDFRYTNSEELNQLLERLAAAFESRIIPWIDRGDPTSLSR